MSSLHQQKKLDDQVKKSDAKESRATRQTYLQGIKDYYKGIDVHIQETLKANEAPPGWSPDDLAADRKQLRDLQGKLSEYEQSDLRTAADAPVDALGPDFKLPAMKSIQEYRVAGARGLASSLLRPPCCPLNLL
jgi:hypothetical protein